MAAATSPAAAASPAIAEAAVSSEGTVGPGSMEGAAIMAETSGTVIAAVENGALRGIGTFQRNGLQLLFGQAEGCRVDQILFSLGALHDEAVLAESVTLQPAVKASPFCVFIFSGLGEQDIASGPDFEKDRAGDAGRAQKEEASKGEIQAGKTGDEVQQYRNHAAYEKEGGAGSQELLYLSIVCLLEIALVDAYITMDFSRLFTKAPVFSQSCETLDWNALIRMEPEAVWHTSRL